MSGEDLQDIDCEEIMDAYDQMSDVERSIQLSRLL